MDLPKRKATRIPGYDYSTRNYYFVTICTKDKKCIFGQPNHLNAFGQIAQDCIESISTHYKNVEIDKYVIMPNHIHMIINIGTDIQTEGLPDLTRIIGQFKMSVTKRIHKLSDNCDVWQRSFHDHIIHNQQSYESIWLYIEGNPGKWEEDCYYI